MKRWIVLSAACLAFQAKADIYKCKDAEGKVIYQGMPCTTGMVGKIKEAPKLSEEDRKLAQEKLDRMIEMNRERAIAREQAWQKQQEQARRLAEQEELAQRQAERERLEQENRERYFWSPWRHRMPWFNQNRLKPEPHRDPQAGRHHPHNEP